MRTLAIVVVGLVSGIIGAVSVSALGGTTASPVATAPRSTPEARNRSDVLRGVVPPGWDARYVKRAPATPSLRDERDEVGRADPSDPSAMIAAREAERLASYQEELAVRERQLTDHERESVDPAWSSSQQQRIQRSFEGQPMIEGALGVRVECRSKSCLVSIQYSSPQDALERRGPFPRVEGCDGLSSVLTPPTSAGPYDVTAMYHCKT